MPLFFKMLWPSSPQEMSRGPSWAPHQPPSLDPLLSVQRPLCVPGYSDPGVGLCFPKETQTCGYFMKQKFSVSVSRPLSVRLGNSPGHFHKSRPLPEVLFFEHLS